MKCYAQHPKLVAFYSGWLGQKTLALAYAAVLQDQHDLWTTAASEVNRLVVVINEAATAKNVALSSGIGLALGELLSQFSAGGYWASVEGNEERAALRRDQRELDDLAADEIGANSETFQPQLALNSDADYTVAAIPATVLDSAVLKFAMALNAPDVSRLGVLLSGFCYRATAQLDVGFVNSVLRDLAAHDLSDLQAENEFRRAVGLSELGRDRLPLSLTAPAPMPMPSVPADGQGAAQDERNSFDRNLGWLVQHRDLILGIVLRRFSVAVPPESSDAEDHPALPGLKGSLLSGVAGATEAGAAGEMESPQRAAVSSKDFAGQTKFWGEEAIAYLGFDRLGLARPDMRLQRLIKKGALRPTKIGGRLVFTREELDRVLEKGDNVRRPGRPRKDRK